ncbi:type I restriction-modification system subunit M N-terminal domain-containing protein, partial [Staphylococcus sp. HMSC074A11]
MSITEKQRQQQAELQKNLWSIADDLRGNMDANEFKNYILGMIFYRFLSEKIEEQAQILLAEDNIDYETAMADEDYRPVLEQEFISRIGYVIEPQYLFGHLVKKIEKQAFEMEDLSNAIKNIENSTRGHDSEDDFIHLFDDLDLNSSRLGNSNAARTKLISKVMMKTSTLPFVHSDMEIDMLGDAYEYLIGQFAASSGKKAGEFYTPQQVSTILAKIVTANKKDIKSVYDPTC